MAALKLEVFQVDSNEQASTVVTDLNALEEARLSSYEQGYAAGWDDSVSAQNEEKDQLAVDLAHNLQSLNFTYHEARAHILRALEPLLVGIVSQLLPEVARSALAPTVLSALLPLAESAADTPVRILFNPSARAALEPLLERTNGLPLALVEEATLGDGQVFLQLGEEEVRVDLDAAIAEVKTALNDFLNLMTKDTNNG
jgi:flagellar assembly protein FliH